jgi:ATP-dependent Lon protease
MVRAETKNPVILFDEIDKISTSMQGDPEAALLEVLDPEQNETFSDHYMEVDVDLSEAIFICTANRLEDISDPLRDRMETIEIPSYTPEDKRLIAQKHLVPKEIQEKGLSGKDVTFTDEAIDYLIDRYTQEAGVRGLQQRIGDICRHLATESVQGDEIKSTVAPDDVQERLGPEEYRKTGSDRIEDPGIATGMAYTKTGGDILFVEASSMPGDGKIKTTGSLGDVMEESADIAINYLKSNASQYPHAKAEAFDNQDFHIHVPEGAIPKDGPSAGITIVAALLSLLRGESISTDIAMTGEATLRGEVLKIGGLREKVVAAYRSGIETVIFPEDNQNDLEEIDTEVRESMTFHPVSEISDVTEILFGE